MLYRRLGICCSLLIVASVSAGCGWWGGDEESNTTDAQQSAAKKMPQTPTAPARARGTLKLNLSLGQRFPLLKTVEQTLSQTPRTNSVGGTAQPTVESRSRLELLLSLQVEQIAEDGRKRFSVRYHRVKYSHDIGGEIVNYDSSNSQNRIPKAAVPLAGLVNNEFGFWLGPDNRVVELVGFDEFLKRCVQDVPIEQRQAVLARLSGSSSDEGLVNFLDDSVGLMPYAVESEDESAARTVSVGDSWSRKHRFTQPIPMFETDRCTLSELTDSTAQIDIVGTIAAAPAHQLRHAAAGVSIAIRGGHAFGTCKTGRETGLPIDSRMERYFDMTVELANGEQFDQRKQIVTTVRAFPDQSGKAALSAKGSTGTPASTTLR
jgi:hypothetical protein